jgi:uncharacterized protein YbaA (DUF1428 family)
MIFSGFDVVLDKGGGERPGYVDGYVLPVPLEKKDAYFEMARKAASAFDRYGAKRVVEAWGDDIRDGKVTDFKRAVQAKEGETVVFSWIEWPDKATRDEGWKKIMEDPDMQPDKENMPFDGMRMFWGGFTPVVDSRAEASATAAERELA